LAALLRVNLTYLWRHGRLPRLNDPSRFTELVQLRKLHDRDQRMSMMADKVAVKSIVADRLGPAWIVPVLWSGMELPALSLWTEPVVVKARHGCNQNLVVRRGEIEWAAVRLLSERWTRRAYGGWLDEWLYREIPRGILVEPFVGVGRDLPIDYKIYVFHGAAMFVQVHLDRVKRHRWIVYDIHWRIISGDQESAARPSALSAMLAAAEELARGFSFARVDFYQPHDHPLFGEMTFYPGSGLDPFDPVWLDEEMGRLWLNAEDFGTAKASFTPLTFAASRLISAIRFSNLGHTEDCRLV
jgi:hypothetical protein